MDIQFQEASIAKVAAAIAEPARTKMLCSLMDGLARTGTELAAIAEVSASTASAHLARLKDTGLLTVHTQGRHRYYALANRHVAQAIEALMVISQKPGKKFVSTAPLRLRIARTCYDHMAGTLAVKLHDHFFEAGWLEVSEADDRLYRLTLEGETEMASLGLDIQTLKAQQRRFACSCLDWSVRRPHLAGALGAAFLRTALDRQWVARDLDSRALALTAKGRKAMSGRFGITVDDDERGQ